MARGTIAKVVRDRGFGFIRGNDGKEVFFHRSGLIGMNFDDLEQGTVADFEVEKGPKGLRAATVRSAAGNAPAPAQQITVPRLYPGRKIPEHVPPTPRARAL